MGIEQILCMNGGEDETSYANNSLFQKQAMLKAKPMLEDSITKLYRSSFPECLKIADLGCSSGPNTLSAVWQIIEIIDSTCKQLNRKLPMFLVFLNDLPGNDFNTIFKSLPTFYDKLRNDKGHEFGSCSIAGVPGSFYGRLFPKRFIHFFHSSYCLHWRSQVPDGLVSESGNSLNKGNIFASKTSPPEVEKAYLDLFDSDFTLFLKSRSVEIIPGGYMVLTFPCTEKNANSSSDRSFTIWELLGLSLNEMVAEGSIEEEKLDRFNLPYYAPAAEEVRHVIQREGSFNIEKLEIFKQDWDAVNHGKDSGMMDKYTRGKNMAMFLRAATETILANHFGNLVMDDLYERLTKKIVEYLEVAKGESTFLVISMTKS